MKRASKSSDTLSAQDWDRTRSRDRFGRVSRGSLYIVLSSARRGIVQTLFVCAAFSYGAISINKKARKENASQKKFC